MLFYNESSELDSKIIVDSVISNLKHRGPEGIGTHIDKQKKLALGHTRLSIFDISLLKATHALHGSLLNHF